MVEIPTVFVWVMILTMSGSGKAMDIAPFQYETEQQCEEAGRAMERTHRGPEWACLGGPKENIGEPQ